MARMARLEMDAGIGITVGTRMEETGTRQKMVMTIGSTVTTILNGTERTIVMSLMEQKENEIQEGIERLKQGTVRGGDTGLVLKLKPRWTRRRSGTPKREIHQATGGQ